MTALGRALTLGKENKEIAAEVGLKPTTVAGTWNRSTRSSRSPIALRQQSSGCVCPTRQVASNGGGHVSGVEYRLPPLDTWSTVAWRAGDKRRYQPCLFLPGQLPFSLAP